MQRTFIDGCAFASGYALSRSRSASGLHSLPSCLAASAPRGSSGISHNVHSSVFLEQRDANEQPVGSRRRFGTIPSIAYSRSFLPPLSTLAPKRGTERSNPSV